MKSAANPYAYATVTAYSPQGAVAAMAMGNPSSPTLTETTTFNSRLQPSSYRQRLLSDQDQGMARKSMDRAPAVTAQRSRWAAGAGRLAWTHHPDWIAQEVIGTAEACN